MFFQVGASSKNQPNQETGAPIQLQPEGGKLLPVEQSWGTLPGQPVSSCVDCLEYQLMQFSARASFFVLLSQRDGSLFYRSLGIKHPQFLSSTSRRGTHRDSRCNAATSARALPEICSREARVEQSVLGNSNTLRWLHPPK